MLDETSFTPEGAHPTPSEAIKVRRNDFDLVAPIYDVLASIVFRGAIRRAQIALLPRLESARKILIIGGGTGWFLLELLRRVPAPHVLYVEKSSKMLASSQKLIEQSAPQHLSRVEFRLGTEESLSLRDGEYDVIVTNFFLDLFADENGLQVASCLAKQLAPSGRWLFVDFQLPARGLSRVYALVLFRIMFTFFNVVARMESRRPPDYEHIFARLGLRTREELLFHASTIHARLLSRVPT